jgi:hypothetical protein
MSPDPAQRIEHPNQTVDDAAQQKQITDIVGFIDAINGDRVSGWAWDRNHPEARLSVEVTLDNAPVATVDADELRDHLTTGGIGDGAHGFAIQLPERLTKEEHHRVSAIVRASGYGGITRLKNQAAVITGDLSLRPSDYTALVDHLEQCVEDQRAGFRWIYQELQNLDQFVRSDTRTIPTIAPAQTPPAADDVTGAIRTIETQFTELVQNQAIIQESGETMAAAQKELNRQLKEIDVFNARIDARLEGLHHPSDEEPKNSDSQKGLKRLVFLLGCLTAASLAIGIRSLLN